MDLAVKWRFFTNLSGGADLEAEESYRWHIQERIGPRMQLGLSTDVWKVSLDDYVKSAKNLYRSMRLGGYDPRQPIPLDEDGELLGGAHRLACAIALNIPFISASHLSRKVWAPPWHYAWFEEHGMPRTWLKRLRDDWELMRDRSHA